MELLIFGLSSLLLVRSVNGQARQAQQCETGYPTCCGGPQQGAGYTCDILLDNTPINVNPGSQFDLTANPHVTNMYSSCTWTLPDGGKCMFDNKTSSNAECPADRSVRWSGNFMGSGKICRISVDNADNRHHGSWKCMIPLGIDYYDSIDVNVAALNTAQVLSIAIPISILLIIIIVFLVCCCCFPAILLGCCGCCRRFMPEKMVRKAELQEEEKRARKGPSGRPLPVVEHQETQGGHYYSDTIDHASRSSSTTNVYANESAQSVNINRDSGNYEAVQYAHVHPTRPNLAPDAQTKTARKISNAASMHSTGQQQHH